MKFFYISSKPNNCGQFVIHEKECEHIPEAVDRDYLGPFNIGPEALRKANLVNPKAVLCEKCGLPVSKTIIISSKKDKSL